METVNYKSIYTPRHASLIKRAASFLLDIILLAIVFVGFLLLFAYLFDYDSTNKALNKMYLDYGVMIPKDATEKLEFCDITQQSCIDAATALENDPMFKQLFVLRQRFLIVGPIGSFLLSLLIFNFILPLIFKNGQSIGKKLFAIGYVSKSEIRIKPIQLFIKFLFGDFIIDSVMTIIGLYYILWGNGYAGLILIFVVVIGNIACFALTKERTFLPDALANMFPIDMQEQMLFDTIEELNNAKAEEAKLYAKNKRKY